MSTFIATMSYDLDASTEADARKLLRAELVGRRWQDRLDGALLPSQTVWMKRAAPPEQTVDDVHAACGKELEQAAASVAATGRKIGIRCAWVQVSGAGTSGLVKLGG